MTRWIRSLGAAACLAPLTLAHALPSAPAAPSRVLLVVSGAGRDGGKTRPGFEMEELAQAYLVLKANGFTIEIASPQGGAVEADKYEADVDFIAAFLADSVAAQQLRTTRRTQDLRGADYAAVYIMGGKGAMFDLPSDSALQRVVGEIAARDGIVAAVCHGPAALAFVRTPAGTPLVAGRRMTGFTNEEELAFGKRWAKEFPFPLESKLREVGARWEEAPLMLPYHVIDGRLITGQNPYSTILVAEAIVRAAGRTPVARTPWREERTMALVTRFLAGDSTAARQALAAAPATYHVQLIGLLGYYQSKQAVAPVDVRRGLTLMYFAGTQWKDPQLSLAIAETHWKLGESAMAKELVTALLSAHPTMKEALALRDTMGR
jgi:putative intracellular protease/amidase